MAVLAILAAVGAPVLAASGPASTTLAEDTVIELLAAEVTIPAGWEVDIEAASQSAVIASKGGVTIETSDVLWFGSTASLLARVGELAYPDGAEVPVVDAEESDVQRTWTIVPAAGTDGGAARVIVAEWEGSAVVLTVAGSPGDVASLDADLAAIVASLQLEGPTIDLDARS